MTAGAANREHEELLVRTANLNNDIKLIKTHQWQTTYYSLLLSAGIIAFLSLVPVQKANPICVPQYFAVFTSLLQACAIVSFNVSFCRRLSRYRISGMVHDRLLNRITGVKHHIDRLERRKHGFWDDLQRVFDTLFFFLFGLMGPAACIAYVWFFNLWLQRQPTL